MLSVAKDAVALLLAATVVWGQPAVREPKYDPNHYQPSDNPCYDANKLPQRCVPDFINAAFNLQVEVTDTCGDRGPTRFCVQTGHIGGVKKVCDTCDQRVMELSHPAAYLTDFNNPNNETWWQSHTMLDGMQYPNHVNITLRLGKAFDITYVRLKFVSPRPESFYILKKNRVDSNWIPWVYYSGSCRSTYKLPEKAPILPGNEAVAQCTREFSDISPLTEGNIAFSTLEGRPSAENFEESLVLQDWVTATEIRIVLTRMNTFGDEIFGDPRVLRSYYYAISDFAVGGRCKCNGHASQCVASTGGGAQQLVCDCKHHTTGVDCQQCEPFYVDRPWKPATSFDANECLPCDCNGLSQRCFFDEKLFEATGHGGHCIDCSGNTKGVHCEECVPNHWRRPREHYCTPCQCNEIGSESGQCDENGQCKCKPGVIGQFCDRCANGFYAFSASGCQDCRCEPSGSLNNQPQCSSLNGECACKTNVEGQRCDKCKPGYFDLAAGNELGCAPCFCYGHSSVCQTTSDHVSTNISSLFLADEEQWTGGSDIRPEDVQWAQIDQAAAVSQINDYPVYFLAPSQFLGDQRFAYNQEMIFTLRVQQNNPAPSKKDVVIVGASGHELSVPIYAQSNPRPTNNFQTFRFRIHANPKYQWSPSIREVDFIGILSNVSAIKIRGTYSKGDVAFLADFHLGSATRADIEGPAAEWVEHCTCTEGFVGQFCESCAPTYKRARQFGGPLTKCVKCECHGHSESCDAESGICICEHNTAGDTCERCARGFYGDALNGTASDCRPCDCPEGGPCVLLPSDGDTICTECPEGYTGRKCETCADEFFGNPPVGETCRHCDCNGNTDANSIGNCDTTTGECKKCIYHTTGFNCERCTPGYWGDALIEPKGDCKACGCYAPGTVRPAADYELLECRQSDGQCTCQPNVIGLRCDQCEVGFFNLSSGNGCHACECDALGSVNGTCDVLSGQCHCKPGVIGRQCDQCAPRHFGFGADGCRACECNANGSETLECDVQTGQCLCKDNVEGRRCDQCSENRYSLRQGCLACDDCYALIQTRKNEINSSVSKLRENLDEIINNPVKVDDPEFDGRVSDVKAEVDELHAKADKKLDGDDTSMQMEVKDLRTQLANSGASVNHVTNRLGKIDERCEVVEAELRKFAAKQANIRNELNAEISFLEKEGDARVAQAQRAADRYGDKSARLTELANLAKELSDRHEAHKNEIKTLADRVANASRQALDEANDAIYGAEKNSQQIAGLYRQVADVERQLNKTRELADEQSADAAQIYDESAKLLSNVESIKLPAVNPDDLRVEADGVKAATASALKDVQTRVLESERILRDAHTALSDAQREFDNIRRKQQEAELMLQEVEKYQNRANVAFEQANRVWNDAEESYASLTDFNDRVQLSKEKALAELANLQAIEAELDETRVIIDDAEAGVGDGLPTAEQAREIAASVNARATGLAQESERLTEAAQRLTDTATEHKTNIDGVVAQLSGIDATTNDFSNQALSDAEKSQKVLRKATLTESSAKSLQEQLVGAEKILLNALDQLNSLENVDDDKLADLERLLSDSEQHYEETAGERQLKEKIRRAEESVAVERRQIDALRKDLENLRGIRDSLPTKCYNLVNLEQEGQRR